ncbi:hypothetical protein EDB83DRAFT_2392324 [Lactarius deliciosus]|nr:hypothetical protein EDB83DRAFT_2392324 [Lactarius deliciosus]
MFGESESESPRVPSPWDRVLSSSARLDKVYYHQEELLLPKLVAEVEEGNVEYKLHLINPSPARFVRLAIYELGVADSGALVGLSPSDLRATLKTLRAMAAEIDARVVIAKEIEVAISEHTFVAAGFRSPAHKQNGSKDKAVKDLSRFLAESDSSPRSFVSATSMTTSSVDSSSPSTTDLQSKPPLVTTRRLHDDDSLFPLLTLDEPHHLAHGLASGEELPIGRSQSGTVTVSKSPMIRTHGGHIAPELYHVQHVHDDVLQEGDEPLLTAFSRLEVADSSWVPEDGHDYPRTDQEEGFLDFSSF